jgi:AcrR family transcriptional regulator
VVNHDNSTDNAGARKGVQQRLLDAAEASFAEKGFGGTSIRELAAAAGCNIAAVNYHFGGKDKLYAEVWRRELHVLRETRIAGIEKVMTAGARQPQLEDLLRSYADAFIEPLADENRGSRLMRLMAREIIDPRLPRHMFLNEMVKPVMAALSAALIKVCPGLPQSKVALTIISLVGQLLHIGRVKAMFDQADSPEWPRFDLNEAIDHIVKFSAAGIRDYAKGDNE